MRHAIEKSLTLIFALTGSCIRRAAAGYPQFRYVDIRTTAGATGWPRRRHRTCIRGSWRPLFELKCTRRLRSTGSR
jgi:hypothetical protein